MNVNAKGVFLVTISSLRKMLHHEYGKQKPKISSNTASMAGKIPGLYLAHYTASKFAVIGFTKDAALELAPFVRDKCKLCLPGYVKTGMQERELQWEANLSNKTVEEVRKGYELQVPLGRLCEPDDVAKVVAFLCRLRG